MENNNLHFTKELYKDVELFFKQFQNNKKYMKKTNIKIVVQGQYDSYTEFANEIETTIENIVKNYNNLIGIPTLFSITSSSDGRQTATIVFYTDTEEKIQESDKSLFDSYHLKSALKYFLSIKQAQNIILTQQEEKILKSFVLFLTGKSSL